MVYQLAQSQAAAADAGARTVPARACNAMNGKSCISTRVIGSLWTAGTLLGSRAECRALFAVLWEIMTARYARREDVVSQVTSRLGRLPDLARADEIGNG
jgi:hypothetical protein